MGSEQTLLDRQLNLELEAATALGVIHKRFPRSIRWAAAWIIIAASNIQLHIRVAQVIQRRCRSKCRSKQCARPRSSFGWNARICSTESNSTSYFAPRSSVLANWYSPLDAKSPKKSMLVTRQNR